MRKWLIGLLVVLLLCGCAKEEEKGDDCGFLINASWEGNDTQCVNVISFKEDGAFSNWCYCGSPVGDGDLAESFRYRAEDKAILLSDGAGEVFEEGKVLYADDWYLIVDLWDRCYVYENVDVERPVAHAEALEYTGTEDMTKPLLYVLGQKDGLLEVSSHDYDGDAKADFEVWTLPMSEDFKCTDVSVKVENDEVTIEVNEISESDYQYLGEYYTGGFVEMNRDGEVASIVFYGELIIY